MSLPELKDKVQRWLSALEIRGVTLTDDGGYSFRNGSTHVFIDFEQRGKDDKAFSVIRIIAPFLQKVPPSAELHEWIATNSNSWLFGHLGVMTSSETGLYIVLLEHVLLGDYLDPEEFRHALIAVAATADEIDDDLVARFGGETFHDSN